MKPAEFEEKEYEAVLYKQLESNRANVWSPGQVFERHIGIDHAMFVESPRVWRILGRAMARGVFMNRYDWGPLWRNRSRRGLPNFRLNLFIQAKRPFVFRRAPRHIRNVGLIGPGWCFNLNDHQQQALETVAARFGNRAAIVYAAPAFNTVTQLFAHTRNVTVVENSTFPDAVRLREHEKWFYDRPGGNGVANPEAEPSHGPTLDERIEKMRSSQESSQNADASSYLAELSKTILSALDNDKLADNPRVSLFLQEVRTLEKELSSVELLSEEVRYFYHVAAFAEWFNVEWFTIS